MTQSHEASRLRILFKQGKTGNLFTVGNRQKSNA